MLDNETTHWQVKLDQVKKDYDNFVYLVSHDLKAPIRGINNLAEWITEDLGNDMPADVKHKMDLLRNRSQHLENMLAAILELSRIPRMDLQVETIALSPFLNDIKDTFAPADVTFSIPDNLPSIYTYAAKLRTIMRQLFDNAIRHNPGRKVHISVTSQTTKDFISLIVHDNGAGIPAEAQSKIFNIFYTGNGTKEGTSIGSGLTISKKIAEFAGGRLVLEESSPAGSTFILIWPLQIVQKP